MQIVALLKEQYPDRVFKTDNNHDTQDPLDAMLAWINPSAAQKPPKPSGDKSGGEPAVVVIGGVVQVQKNHRKKTNPPHFNVLLHRLCVVLRMFQLHLVMLAMKLGK